MHKIQLGVIGIGMAWHRLHWPALQKLQDKYEITALCNRTKEDALAFARTINLNESKVYDDYNMMLENEKFDAVDVLVPIEENFEAAAAVVKSNVNLIVEKPLASTMQGAKRLLELHQTHPVLIMVAENYRYNEEINRIRDFVKEGKIGDIAYFIFNQFVNFEEEMKKNTFAATEWRQYPDFRGGTFLDAAIHDLAGLRHIFGAVDQVYAMGRPQEEDFSPYRIITTQIKFRSGVIGSYSYYTDGKETQRPLIGLRILGNKGEIYLEERSCGIINVSYYNGSAEQVPYQPERGYYNELLNFYNAMMGYEEITVTPEVEYGDLKMVFDVLQSIKNNHPVIVDLQNPFKQISVPTKV